MLTTTSFSRLLVFLSGLILTVTACSDHRDPNFRPDIALSATSLGTILTDQAGRTLYFYANDADGNTNCVGQCNVVWPTFYKENPTLDGNLNGADFGVITRPDGSKQTTYKGWPLYYYRTDLKAGDVIGENVGGVWFVAKPNYSVMIANFQLKGHDNIDYTSLLVPGTGRTMYFVDDRGRTLYTFSRDTQNMNTFTREDFANNATWPIYETSLNEVPSSLNKSLFRVITKAGRQQLTFNGWPLYYFGQDGQQRGSNKGVSFPRPGVWPIASRTLPAAP